MIYPWIWRHLPGPIGVRLVLVLVLLLAVVAVCFGLVFPRIERGLPWLAVTVGNGDG